MLSESKKNIIIFKYAFPALILLIIINLITLLQALFISTDLFEFGKIDALEYWSAFRILLNGADPYSDIEMLSLQSKIRTTLQPTMMWNPPWLLSTFSLLLQIENFQHFCQIWFITSISAYILSAIILIRNFVAKGSQEIFLWILILSFPPLNANLILGQISNWILLGISFILCGIKNRLPMLTGAGLLLVSLKPHLIIAALPLIIFEILSYKHNLDSIIKMLIVPLSAILPIAWIYPGSIKSWVFSMSGRSLPTLTHSTRDWATTTIPSALIKLTDISFNYELLTLVAITLIYCVIIASATIRGMQFSYKFMLILVVAIPSSCFGFFYDYVIVIPAFIILWDRLYNHKNILLRILIFQITAITFSSSIMTNLQQGLFIIIPVCVFLAYSLIKNSPNNLNQNL